MSALEAADALSVEQDRGNAGQGTSRSLAFETDKTCDR